ncbi:helix-turn-helix domain-containing protein [Natrialbaceae archaeon A-chndr2]
MSAQSADTGQPGVSALEDGIVVELELEHPSLLLGSTLRRFPAVSITLEYWSELDDGRTMVFFTVRCADDDLDPFEAALAADPTISDATFVDEYPRKRVYRAEITEETLRVTSQITEAGGHILDRSSGQTGWTVQIRFPDRDGLVAFNRSCDSRDISFHVTQLRMAKPGERAVLGLTQKQEALLRVAYEEGYFEVPRGISQDELADRLNVSKSAVSQRLRRAMNELCASSLSNAPK